MSSSSFSPLYVRDGRRRYQQATAEQIIEAARQVVDQRMCRGTAFTDPAIARNFFRDKLAGLEREVFAAAFLDSRHRLVGYAELFFGTIDGSEVHPREVVREALLRNAAALIVAHSVSRNIMAGGRHRGEGAGVFPDGQGDIAGHGANARRGRCDACWRAVAVAAGSAAGCG